MTKITQETTIEELQKKLRKAHASIGFAGRFAFTIDQTAGIHSGHTAGGCYITHWFRPTPYAFEDCKAVGSGSVQDCVDALERYVRSYPVPEPKRFSVELPATTEEASPS